MHVSAIYRFVFLHGGRDVASGEPLAVWPLVNFVKGEGEGGNPKVFGMV